MDEKTIPETKARQGRRGWQVLLVLVVGLALALLAWYAAELLVSPPADQPAAVQGEAN